jgi:hypothetical protein
LTWIKSFWNLTKIQNQITANIVAVSTYNDASKIIKKKFHGQEFESAGKSKSTGCRDLAKNGKMVYCFDLSGSVNGKIYLSGFPQYNDKSKEIYFDELDMF